jgi:hypothetical protein
MQIKENKLSIMLEKAIKSMRRLKYKLSNPGASYKPGDFSKASIF